jgi:hypothetical protein
MVTARKTAARERDIDALRLDGTLSRKAFTIAGRFLLLDVAE